MVSKKHIIRKKVHLSAVNLVLLLQQITPVSVRDDYSQGINSWYIIYSMKLIISSAHDLSVIRW